MKDVAQKEGSRFRYSDDLAQLQQSMGLGYWEFYRDSRILRFSPDIFQSLGLSPTDDLQLHFDDYVQFILEEDRGVVTEAILKAIESRTHFEAEIRRKNKQLDKFRWVLVKGKPIFEADGSCKVVVGVSIDIKSSQSKELELAKNEMLLNTIIDQTEDTLWAVDHQFKILYYNSSFQKGLKAFYNIDLEKGLDMIEAFVAVGQSELAASYKADYEKALQGEPFTKVQVYEVLGAKIFAELTFSPLVNEGLNIGVSVFSKDITERKKSELENNILFESIKESQEMLSSAFSATSSGFFIYKSLFDNQGHVVDFQLSSMNEAAVNMLRPEFRNTIGKKLSETAPNYWQLGHFDLMKRVFETGDGVDVEIDATENSREFLGRWLQMGVNKVSQGVFINVRDVTEAREKALAIEHTLERVQNLNEELAIREEELTASEEELRQNLEYQSRLLDENQIKQANLMALINNTNEGIVYLDKYGFLVECNEAYKKWLLKKKPDYYQDPCPIIDLIEDSYKVPFNQSINTALKGEASVIVERTINFKKQTKVFEHSFFPVKSYSNESVGITIWSKDISEKESAKRILEDNELRYRIVSKVTSDAMWDFDVANDKLTWFSGFNHYTQFVSDEGESISRWEEAIHPEDKARVLKAFNTFLEMDCPFEVSYRLFKFDGSVMYVIDSGYAIRDVNGKAIRAIGGMRNITELMEKQYELADISKKMGEYKLMALRSVMNPHFIFNSLNSIQYFITRNDRRNAINYLSYFSKLIRGILNSSVSQTTALSEELNLLRYYTELELVRFEEKFHVVFDIQADLDIDNIQIPSLLVQPYVENSILHGLYNRTQGGNLIIRCYEEANDILVFEVDDDGIGREAAQSIREKSFGSHKSVGMMVTKERLEMINKIDTVAVEIIDKEEKGQATGTKVVIKIQLQDY